MAITLDGTNGILPPDFEPSSSTTPTTGLFLPTTNALGFATNSTERLRLDASGNLGLGVTPSAWGSGWSAMQIGGNGSLFADKTAGAGKLCAVTQNAYHNGTNNIYISSDSASRYRQGSGIHIWETAPSGTAGNAISFTQAMTLDASGNLGIGTTGPGSKLEVAAATGQTAGQIRINNPSSFAANDVLGVDFRIQGSLQSFVRAIVENGSTAATALTFGTATGGNLGTERARIDSSGNLLVGTTSFTNSNNKGLAVWFSSATNSGGEGSIEFRNTSTSTNSDPNPVLGIYKGSATTTSAQRFVQFYCSAGAQAMGGIVGNGATNVQFVSLSDAREKTNAQPIAGALQKINALNPVSFDWIATGEHVNAGFVAQDVLEVFPEFVVDNISNAGQEQRYGLTGGMTGGIIPHLVKAIQELSAKVTALEAK